MFNFLMIVVEQSMIYVPLSLASYISFSLLKIPDLSLESAYLMGAFFAGLALQVMQGYSTLFTLLVVFMASIVGGMIVGLTSSCITRYGKIPHLLSSIITFGLYQGFFLLCSDPYISLARYNNVLMIIPYSSKHPELLVLSLINLMVCCICVYLFRTQLGYSFSIFGHNPYFFKHFRRSTNYVFITGVAIANGLAGLAGFFFAQTNNLIEINMGIGKALFCITVLILGRSVVNNQKPCVSIAIVGTGLYFALQQLLLKVGFNLKYFTMVQSLLVLIILLVIYKKNHAQHDQLGV